jgi:predicted porin
VSRNEGDSFRDGEYVEAALGYAYRPVMHERLNMLLRYSYLHDLPGVDQVTVTGDTEGPQQKSHIFSVDVDYDLSPKLTLGAKYGYRKSQLRDRTSGDESTSTANLGILRLDWHVVHKWDALLEGRVMHTEESDLTETGAVAGLYRHLGNNAKLGFGYEWGEVSNDMADITYEGRGAFVNLIAKF